MSKTKYKLSSENKDIGIELIGLGKIFGKDFKALDNINIQFKKNEITGLIGFNGSGKTTTFNILSELLEKHEGEFLFDGEKLTPATRKKISYLTAGSEPKNAMKALTHLLDLGVLYGLDKKTANDKIYEIAKKIEFDGMLKSPIKSLSKGNQQKIKIIQVFLNPNMEFLFLDEPFDGLDPVMVEKVKKLFLELKNVTILITSHRMEVIQSMCNEFYVLKNGKLADAKKTSDASVLVRVNGKLKMDKIKKLSYVSKVKKNEDGEWQFMISDMSKFILVNKLLLKEKEFEYIGIKDKNIADSVFKGEL